MGEFIDGKARAAAVAAVLARRGEAERARAEAGVAQAAAAWVAGDGDAAAFAAFCADWYEPAGPGLEALFLRLESFLEGVQGAATRASRSARWGVDVDSGPLIPLDGLLSSWSPFAHLPDDLFGNKVAFVVLLNFPRLGLADKLRDGATWSRRRWAGQRLGELFADRVPAPVLQLRAAAGAAAGNYVSSYDIHAGALRDAEGAPFAEDRRLLMHWGMRDEIKAWYGREGAWRRQRVLARAMERAVDGSIPAAAIGAPGFAWDPDRPAGESEGPRRWELMLGVFRAELAIDAHSPASPDLFARRFDVDRELPVAEVEALLESLFEGPTFAATSRRVAERLGRPLESWDVWFRDFGAGAGRPPEAELDALTRARWPDAAAFRDSIPGILRGLGFGPDEADWLAARIAVDPARGSGHAMPAASRDDLVRLRTRIGPAGMDYKAFNIAMHELGHNVEQVLSLHGIDRYLLAGVPNTAFTEAFAFVFQARDLAALGLAPAGGGAAEDGPGILSDYWATCEIAGVALVDIGTWRWLYAHPDADAAALRDAALDVARGVWNRLFAPAFALRDSPILASYSHMIDYPLYLPDYPLGHILAFMVEERIRAGSLAGEMSRMCRLGRLSPAEWLRQATGGRLSTRPLLEAAARALGR